MFIENEIVLYEGDYYECQIIENGYLLSNDDNDEIEVDSDEEFEYIDTVDEDSFFEEVSELIADKLISDGKRSIAISMEENDNIGEIVDDIRNHVYTLPGIREKYDKEVIYEAMDNSEVFISYFNRYLLKGIGSALSGYSEDIDGNTYDDEGNIVENDFDDDNE